MKINERFLAIIITLLSLVVIISLLFLPAIFNHINKKNIEIYKNIDTIQRKDEKVFIYRYQK
jgi:F0F1-type ATP synthase membrane subunit b/b'